MKRGFFTIMSAQFFSSLADNALLVASIELIRATNPPSWQEAALPMVFAVFYVVLAPFVGAFSDSMPKGKVMFIANGIKILGCSLMLFGLHPLLAYMVVGLGAAAYSPAKYGILTELLPTSQLVKGNGWMEGFTIASIVLGIVLGGQLVGQNVSSRLLSFDFPFIDTSVDTAPEAAILSLIFVYLTAAWFNLRIPRTGAELRPMPSNPLELLPDFWHCLQTLSRDKLGQISLAATSVFWGASANMRVIVFAWAAATFHFNTTQASALGGVVVIGTVVGAIVASMRTRLEHATRLLPLGIGIGLLIIGLNVIDNIWVAAPFLVLLGGFGGFLVVPMNAMLQHRGHNLMGAGRSIAVQNFSEQACIVALGAFYSFSTGLGLSAFGSIAAFGLVVASSMWLVKRWHESNLQRYPKELASLLALARDDKSHG